MICAYDFVNSTDYLQIFKREVRNIPKEELIYFAPEIKNILDIDSITMNFNPFKTIIYSLGLLMLQLLTNEEIKENAVEEIFSRYEKKCFKALSKEGILKQVDKFLSNLRKLINNDPHKRPDANEIFSNEV